MHRYVPFLRRLSEHVRLIVFNPRGTGLSDRPRNVTLEARMDDINAVLDATGTERAMLFGVAESANVCLLYAATFPERCTRLAVLSPYPRAVTSETYPYGSPESEWLDWLREMREHWGEREFLREFSRAIDPAIADDEERLDHFIWMHRLSASPSSAAEFARMAMETDVTDVLGSIRVPTLILHTADERGRSRYVAERIPGRPDRGGRRRAARAVLGRGRRQPARLRTGCRGAFRSRLGPGNGSLHRPRRLDEARRRARRRALAGDPRRAPASGPQGTGSSSRNRGRHRRRRLLLPLRRPRARDRVRSADRGGRPGLDLEVRAGVHTGECQVAGEKLAGIAVHVGARVMAAAAPGEVLVSSTVKDLVAGSDFAFADRGEPELKGVPGRVRLYAVVP